MANDTFTWKGLNSAAYGVRALVLPPMVIPQERATFETVPGRSGSLTLLEGDGVYDDYELTLECLLTADADPDAVRAWLQGSGTLALPNRTGGRWEGRISNQIEMEKILAARSERTFTLVFRVQPYFYLDDSADLVFTGPGPFTFTNPGLAASAPRIAIAGSGDLVLTVNTQVVTLSGLEDGIILDTQLMDALSPDGSLLMNDAMGGDFPVLPPGAIQLDWASDETGSGGDVTQITVTPRWRTL